mmetsp:Transcript_40649/g.105531  ORF Transcript_40649/g.105531 Transcript_40649/m.105531 type:complete len:85 (-) Transcript_40649:299-553(-)
MVVGVPIFSTADIVPTAKALADESCDSSKMLDNEYGDLFTMDIESVGSLFPRCQREKIAEVHPYPTPLFVPPVPMQEKAQQKFV